MDGWLDLRIPKRRALVLYALLVRYEEKGKLEPLDPAERQALAQVHGALERAEGGDLDFDDWRSAVAQAYEELREEARDLWGPTGFPPAD